MTSSDGQVGKNLWERERELVCPSTGRLESMAGLRRRQWSDTTGIESADRIVRRCETRRITKVFSCQKWRLFTLSRSSWEQFQNFMGHAFRISWAPCFQWPAPLSPYSHTLMQSQVGPSHPSKPFPTEVPTFWTSSVLVSVECSPHLSQSINHLASPHSYRPKRLLYLAVSLGAWALWRAILLMGLYCFLSLLVLDLQLSPCRFAVLGSPSLSTLFS